MATLEEQITALTTALKANTAAVLASKGGSAAGSSGTPGTSTGSTTTAAGKSKYTIDQVKAMAVKLRDEVSEDAAKKTIKKHGGGNLAELGNKKGVWDKFVADAEKQIADATNTEDETGGDETTDESDGL